MGSTAQIISGVLPALLTPFGADGSVNVDMIRRLVALHLDQGCHGFFACGSTGEGLLLSREERKLVVQTVIEEVAGQVPVVVHVGAMSTKESVDLSKDAKRLGAAAVSSIPPIYYPVGLDGIIGHLRAIATASDLPTYYYHIPLISCVLLTLDDFLEMVDKVDGLVGLKFTYPDLFLLWCILDAVGSKISVLNGTDEQLFQALLTGAVGGIGSTYNYQSGTIVKIYDAFRRGDYETARQLQWKANAVVRALRRNGGNLAAEKAIMKMLGYDLGAPRGPIQPFPEDHTHRIREELEEIGFFDERAVARAAI